MEPCERALGWGCWQLGVEWSFRAEVIMKAEKS